jgi:hypothetical protein
MPKVEVDNTICVEPFSGNPVNTVVILMEFIIAQLIEHEQQDQDAARHPYSQTCNIDQAVTRVFLDIPESYF